MNRVEKDEAIKIMKKLVKNPYIKGGVALLTAKAIGDHLLENKASIVTNIRYSLFPPVTENPMLLWVEGCVWFIALGSVVGLGIKTYTEIKKNPDKAGSILLKDGICLGVCVGTISYIYKVCSSVL